MQHLNRLTFVQGAQKKLLHCYKKLKHFFMNLIEQAKGNIKRLWQTIK